MAVDLTHNRGQHMLASTTVLAVFAVLSLMALGVARHPSSVQGAGNGLLWMDIMLLLAYGTAGVWVWYEGRPEVNLSLPDRHPGWRTFRRRICRQSRH